MVTSLVGKRFGNLTCPKMVSPIRDAAIDGMVEAMLAPAPKIQLTIKKKVDICKK